MGTGLAAVSVEERGQGCRQGALSAGGRPLAAGLHAQRWAWTRRLSLSRGARGRQVSVHVTSHVPARHSVIRPMPRSPQRPCHRDRECRAGGAEGLARRGIGLCQLLSGSASQSGPQCRLALLPCMLHFPEA